MFHQAFLVIAASIREFRDKFFEWVKQRFESALSLSAGTIEFRQATPRFRQEKRIQVYLRKSQVRSILCDSSITSSFKLEQ